jgi:CDP-glucose 4,6-dehydratase
VHDVVDEFGKSWGVSLNTKIDSEDFQYETEILRLNSTKSMSVLSWSNKLDFNETIKWTAEWYKERANGRSAFELCNEQISNFYQV